MFRHMFNHQLYRFTQKILPLILASYVSSAYADSGKVRLTAIDANTQRPIPNADITLIARDGTTTKGITNQQGLAQIEALNAGLYTLVIGHPDYQSVRLPRIRVLDDKTT